MLQQTCFFKEPDARSFRLGPTIKAKLLRQLTLLVSNINKTDVVSKNDIIEYDDMNDKMYIYFSKEPYKSYIMLIKSGVDPNRNK